MMEHVFRIECPDDVAAAITVCRRKRAMEHRKQISKVHPLTGAPCKKQCKRDAAVPPLRRTTLAAVSLTQAKNGYGWPRFEDGVDDVVLHDQTDRIWLEMEWQAPCASKESCGTAEA
uniref:Uncharacterized protein n=1 Tax=Anopheles coluzzii TaxID=1518534 RepID=A0A8W7PY86_ANOCL